MFQFRKQYTFKYFKIKKAIYNITNDTREFSMYEKSVQYKLKNFTIVFRA